MRNLPQIYMEKMKVWGKLGENSRPLKVNYMAQKMLVKEAWGMHRDREERRIICARDTTHAKAQK
jgi:hypothetical protein